MIYFKSFPTTLYQISDAQRGKPAEFVGMIDIVRNVRFKQEILDNISYFDYYTMREGETIEAVSEKFYGSPYYHWVLMLLNDRFDYINDLPLNQFQFETYIEKAYPTDYLDEEYGLTARSLIIDLVDENGFSVDINDGEGETTRILDTNTGSLVASRPVVSVQLYDETIKRRIKKFVFKDDNSALDPKLYQIDFGAMPDVSPVYAYDLELQANDNKRNIRIISPQVLNIVVDNFKELM